MNLSAKPPGRRCRSGKTGNMQPTMPPQAGQAQAGDFSTFCPSYQIEYNLGSINGLFVDIFGLFSGFALFVDLRPIFRQCLKMAIAGMHNCLVLAFVLACNSKASGMQ